jgi:hypothetical protein
MPDTFMGKLFLPGLLLQFSQIISGGIRFGMSSYREKTKPAK